MPLPVPSPVCVASASASASEAAAAGARVERHEQPRGKGAALATGWSGNVDFMEGLSELLIDHAMIPVRDPAGVYRAFGQSWAEPDIEDGARKLKALHVSPVRRAELALLGMEVVRSQMASWSRESLADLAKLIA